MSTTFYVPVNTRTTKDSTDTNYGRWLSLCDETFEDMTGVSIHDCPDWHWRDSYDAEIMVADAINDYLAWLKVNAAELFGSMLENL